MELTGGGRAGGARGMSGVVVSRARGRIRARGCAPWVLPTARSRAKLGWAGSRGPGIFRSWRYAGKERAWKDVGHRPPRVPGLFLMVMRSGAERPRGCGVLPPPLAQALGRAFAEQTKPAGRYDRRNESLSYVGSGKGRWGGGGIPGRGWGPLIS